MDEGRAQELFIETNWQLKLRQRLRNITLSEGKFLQILGEIEISPHEESPFIRLGNKYIFDILRKGECERFRVDKDRNDKLSLYLRALVLNRRVQYESNPRNDMSLFERMEMGLISENLRRFGRGFSSPAEYYLLIASKQEMVWLADRLAKERTKPYSLLLCTNDELQIEIASQENEKKILQVRYPIWTCPGANEEEIRRIILPQEEKRREERMESQAGGQGTVTIKRVPYNESA